MLKVIYIPVYKQQQLYANRGVHHISCVCLFTCDARAIYWEVCATSYVNTTRSILENNLQGLPAISTVIYILYTVKQKLRFHPRALKS